MASARSTVSMARTTPAQNPRGEQSTIFSGGLACMGRSRTDESPGRAGNGRFKWDFPDEDLGLLSGAVKAVHQTIAPQAPDGLYRGQFPSSLMTTASPPRGGRSTKEICHEQCTADAKGDCRVAGR